MAKRYVVYSDIPATVTTTTTVTVGAIQPYDASGGTFTLNMPASPATGDRAGVMEVVGDTTSVTISGNGNNIQDPASPATLVSSFTFGQAYNTLVYVFTGAHWQLV